MAASNTMHLNTDVGWRHVRPHIKEVGIWKEATGFWQKQSGVWVPFYERTQGTITMGGSGTVWDSHPSQGGTTAMPTHKNGQISWVRWDTAANVFQVGMDTTGYLSDFIRFFLFGALDDAGATAYVTNLGTYAGGVWTWPIAVYSPDRGVPITFSAVG